MFEPAIALVDVAVNAIAVDVAIVSCGEVTDVANVVVVGGVGDVVIVVVLTEVVVDEVVIDALTVADADVVVVAVSSSMSTQSSYDSEKMIY